jgi:hypothetical protein
MILAPKEEIAPRPVPAPQPAPPQEARLNYRKNRVQGQSFEEKIPALGAPCTLRGALVCDNKRGEDLGLWSRPEVNLDKARSQGWQQPPN